MVGRVEKMGIHGRSQDLWYGMEKIALDWNIPVFGMMGSQGAYRATMSWNYILMLADLA